MAFCEGDAAIEWKGGRRYISLKFLYGKSINDVVVMEGHKWKTYVNRFHSDKYETMNNAPKWYRQQLNRTLKRKQQQALKRAIKTENLDDLAMPKQVKDAAWFW